MSSSLHDVIVMSSSFPSNTDHPLSRLLGEGQYSVYVVLKALSSAVEQAGKLPTVVITPDDQKPTELTHTEREECCLVAMACFGNHYAACGVILEESADRRKQRFSTNVKAVHKD